MQQIFNPFIHFICRFIGKSDGEDLPGGDAMFDEASDAVGESPCFSTPRTSDNEEGATCVFHRSLLFGIELLEKRVMHCCFRHETTS